jgi:hypothetical protein
VDTKKDVGLYLFFPKKTFFFLIIYDSYMTAYKRFFPVVALFFIRSGDSISAFCTMNDFFQNDFHIPDFQFIAAKKNKKIID